MTMSSDRYSEVEKIMLLEKAGMPVSDHISSVELEDKFHQLQEKVLANQESVGHLDHSEIAELAESAEMASIVIRTLTPGNGAIPRSLSSSAIKELQSALNKVPWETVGAVALEGAKFLVAGSMASTPQTLAIMVGVTLIMRLRFGTIFNGGGNSIQLLLQNLNAKDPEELAVAAMNIIKNLVKEPKEVLLQIEGTGSKVFTAFEKKLASLAHSMGFEMAAPAVAVAEKNMHLTPFHMKPKPKGAEYND